MSNAKHTPGKWVAAPDPAGIVDDWMVGVEGGMPDQVAVCCECDARLIASAPELLEALQGMVKQFGYDVVHPNGLVHDEHEAIRSAMSAIAKATGGTA